MCHLWGIRQQGGSSDLEGAHSGWQGESARDKLIADTNLSVHVIGRISDPTVGGDVYKDWNNEFRQHTCAIAVSRLSAERRISMVS